METETELVKMIFAISVLEVREAESVVAHSQQP